jgi:putative FmdB family regulatory protein
MPTYEYQCEKCDRTFEVAQSMKDEPLKSCPKDRCQQKTWGKGKVRRLIGTGAGLIFKGSGFYITDYRSEGYKAAAKSDSSGGGEPAKTESKPESKPSKTETKPPAKSPAKND